ncbi:MAG: YetF domain-containing protein [bacterium]
MSDLFLLSIESIAIYLLVIFCLRLIGKKGLSELSVPDLVLVILIGEALGSLIPEENRFVSAIVCIASLTFVNFLLTRFLFKSKKFKKLVEGSPVVLVRNGRVFDSNLRSEKVTMEDLYEAIRSKGVDSLEKVDLAMLETDGEISILIKDKDKDKN